MERLAVLEARDKFAEILNRVAYGKARFVVQRYGKDLAAIVPLEDLEKVLGEEGLPPKEARPLRRRAKPTARKR